MPIVSICIPQMGEGLQEALLVEFIKQPGDYVKRDEPIYVMETDKATTDIESPYTGRLLEWKVKPGTVLPIGTEVAVMEVEASTAVDNVVSHPIPETASIATEEDDEASVSIPPRTRKYLKDKGLLGIAHTIPCRGTKLTPEDVDNFLAGRESASEETATTVDSTTDAPFDERPVSKQQITLNYRLVRSVQTTVPVTVMTEVDWSALDQARQKVKALGGKETSFSMMLWCVVQSMANQPQFRTTLVGDGTSYRTYRHVNIGVAVALPGDELVTAVLRSADRFTRNEFFDSLNKQIELARRGVDQADPSITVSVSNIGSASMRFGIPAIVSPAAATLALGEVFEAPIPTSTGFAFQKRAQLTLAFDHRIINGVGAASFMNDLKNRIQTYS